MPTAENPYDEEPDDQHSTLEGEDKDASAVGLLPKSVLAGKEYEVGDTVTLKITAIHDDQVQVESTSGREKEPDEGEKEEPEEAPETQPEAEPAPEPVAAGPYD